MTEEVGNSDSKKTDIVQKDEGYKKLAPGMRAGRLDKLAEEFIKCGDLEVAYVKCGYFSQDAGRLAGRIKELRASWHFKLAIERACERLYLKALRDVRDNGAPSSVVAAARYTYEYFVGRKPKFDSGPGGRRNKNKRKEEGGTW